MTLARLARLASAAALLAALVVLPGSSTGCVGSERREPGASPREDGPTPEPPREGAALDDAATRAPSAEGERTRLDAFFGEPDAPRLAVLREGEIVRVERGRGGRSVGLRLTFADGSRGYFKPEQRFSGASDVAELASYHVDRLLGLGRVPPTTLRVLPYALLAAALAGHPHRDEVIVRPDGTVRGSLVAWIETPLVPLALGAGFERFFRLDPPPAITPFQRASVYTAQASGREPVTPPRDASGAPLAPAIAPDTETRPAELSDLVLFDHLVNNIDRWGGGFTNVRTLGAGGPLVFLDQGAAFGPGQQGRGFMTRRLESVQRFRRSTIEALARFDVEDLERALDADAARVGSAEPLLDDAHLEALEARRRAILAHVGARRAAAGDEASLPW